MRFVVFGAGAIGGVLAARLHQGGENDVVVVARGAHYRAIRNGGLRLMTPDGRVHVLQIPAVRGIRSVRLNSGDIVFLAVKSQDTLLALRELANATSCRIAVACVQNGVENERVAARFFESVYGVLVMCPATHLEPGIVEIAAAPRSGILDIGCYPSGRDARAEFISGVLRSATYISEVREDVMSWKYTKLLANLGNALEALIGAEALGSSLAELLRTEGEAVLRAAGIPLISRDEFQFRANQLSYSAGATIISSTVQSLHRGTQSIETDYLNGEIVTIARLHGVQAPANELVQLLVRRLVREGHAAGSYSLEEIGRYLASPRDFLRCRATTRSQGL